MGRRPEQITLYARREKKKLLREASKRSGKSMSSLVFNYALPFWLKHNPKELEDLAEEFEHIREIQEAKEEERKSGDYLGSFDKMEEKIQRIKERIRKRDITQEMGKILIQKTRDHFELSQRAYEDILKMKKPREKSKRGKPTAEMKRRLKAKLDERIIVERHDLDKGQLKLMKKHAKDEGISLKEAAEILIGD